MNSQDFLTLNLLGAGAFVFWYLLSRGGGRRPTRLDMSAKDTAPPLMNAEPESPVSVVALRSATRPEAVEKKAKNLNVMFNYNGHSWDAYEVLGVPAGASIKTVTEAFQTALRRSDKDSMEFLETAYKAIVDRF